MDIVSFFKIPTKVLGIEICFTPEGKRVFISKLESKKGEINLIDNSEIAIAELEAYIKKEKTNFKILLTGKGLLVQERQAKFSDEFISEINGSNQTIIRSDVLAPSLLELTKSHLFAGLTLGNKVLSNFASKLGIDHLSSYCYVSQLETKPNWELEHKTIDVSGQDISSKYTGSYLVGLSVYLKEASTISTNNLAGSDFYFNHTIKKSVLVGGVLLLIVLLFNAFLWDDYSTKNKALSLKQKVSSNYTDTYTKLNEELEKKAEYYTKLGYDNTQMLSFYADDLGVSVPKSIVLSELEVYPLDKIVLKKEKKYDFDQKTIHLTGQSSEIIAFNNWIDELKEMEWVDDLKVENYQFDNNNQVSVFNLKINLK